jgi:hypothetical protein
MSEIGNGRRHARGLRQWQRLVRRTSGKHRDKPGNQATSFHKAMKIPLSTTHDLSKSGGRPSDL